MAAHESLGPQFMYHHSPSYNRELIQTHGLQPSNPFSDEPEDSHFAPTGVYLTSRRQRSYGHDIWRVDVTGLNLHPDPHEDSSALRPSSYTAQSIPPERFRLSDRAKKDADEQ